LLRILNNPKNEEYEDMINWLGGEFDPKLFDPESVLFDDPKKRFKLTNEG
jgi:Plasmid pRiA4b ORF-3-like protein